MLCRDGHANWRSPAMREEIVDLRGGVGVDAEQDIAQARERLT
jgi:hypothetical protein